MRRFGKGLGRVLAVIIVICAGLWIFGPYEPVDLKAEFEPRKFGEGVQVYFESVESRYDDITPDVEKRVIWAGQKETRTPISLLYIHGFSATSQEIRPVPDRIAKALGANLVYTRLRGHGRDSAAMAEATANDWMFDTAEGLAAARAVGDKVIVLSTSTGGTLAAAAAMDPELSKDVVGMIFVSPNFGINDPFAFLLTLPGARYFVPVLMGKERSHTSDKLDQNLYWTLSYPWVSVMPMAALVKKVAALDFSQTTVPALFWFSETDHVVRPDVTQKIADKWGGPATVKIVKMGPNDDPSSHVITGDIMSPDQTDLTVTGMLEWIKKAGL